MFHRIQELGGKGFIGYFHPKKALTYLLGPLRRSKNNESEPFFGPGGAVPVVCPELAHGVRGSLGRGRDCGAAGTARRRGRCCRHHLPAFGHPHRSRVRDGCLCRHINCVGGLLSCRKAKRFAESSILSQTQRLRLVQRPNRSALCLHHLVVARCSVQSALVLEAVSGPS